MSGIFISYRREDSAPYAGRLYDRLCAHFGADQVFMDVDDIPPGADFVAHIEATIASCAAMVVVIGKNWLTASNADGQLRLSDPSDYMSLEIALALQKNILVIPVLVYGATMPQPKDLPKHLSGLAQRNAIILNDQDFQRDTQPLLQTLERIPGLARGGSPVSTTKARPIATRRRKLWVAPIVLLMVMTALWWQWHQREKVAAAFSGMWQGEVTYSWGATHTEQFLFEAEGEKLFGTASFLAFKRGIENGQIDGERISFNVRYQEALGAATMGRMNRYSGTLSGNQIHFRMQDDKGGPPVEFVARKVESAG
jgi:hypothetical protein